MTYKVQIDGLQRDATPDEAAAIDALTAADTAQKQVAADKVAARASALTKLKALGLTDAEIAALMGGN